jgi:hypothetical protein
MNFRIPCATTIEASTIAIAELLLTPNNEPYNAPRIALTLRIAFAERAASISLLAVHDRRRIVIA